MNRGRNRLGSVALAVLLLGASMAIARPAAADSGSVTIQNFSFNPGTVTVPVGSTITWTNSDGVAHTTTSDTGLWDSGALSNGGRYSFTFNQAGTFTYHCNIHPYMTGSIVVQGAVVPTATVPPAPTATNSPAPTAVPTGVPTAVSTIAPTPVPTTPPTAVSTPAPTPTSGTSGSKGKKTIAARPKGLTFAFSPKTTTVKVGTKVTWVNDSQALHTVTSKSRRWKFNKQLNRTSVSYTFKKAGTYLYHCTFHPGMVGKIVVKK